MHLGESLLSYWPRMFSMALIIIELLMDKQQVMSRLSSSSRQTKSLTWTSLLRRIETSATVSEENPPTEGIGLALKVALDTAPATSVPTTSISSRFGNQRSVRKTCLDLHQEAYGSRASKASRSHEAWRRHSRQPRQRGSKLES